MIRARPLRFAAAVLALWTGGRIWVVLLNTPPPPGLPRHSLAATLARPTPLPSGVPTSSPPVRAAGAVAPAPSARASRSTGTLPAPPPDATRGRGMLLAYARGGSSPLTMLSLAGTNAPLATAGVADPRAPAIPGRRRFGGYGWLFARGAGAPGLAGGGQLGGSQAGIRLDYALSPNLALTGRFSTPLATRTGREAALGLNWKPVPDLPLSLTVERRLGLDKGGRNAFAAFAAGGVGPIDLPAKFSLEAYGQAGMVGLDRRDGFADGAASLTRKLVDADRASIALGGGLWGAAQPGVSRLDIGPRLRVRLDSGAIAIGASLDWRQRIAGNARPRSGLALTLDGSF